MTQINPSESCRLATIAGPAYFEIQADDPVRAAEFYGTLFGWKFEREPNLPIEYWRIETGGIRGGLLKRPAATPPPECGINGFVCSFAVDDFDAFSERTQAKGGIIALPKFEVPGVCWQGYFVDPDGNTFGVFEPLQKEETR